MCFVLLCNIKNLHYIDVIIILLLMCGDVEANPGFERQSNVHVDYTSVLSVLHLNTRSVRNKLNYICFENVFD